MKNIFFNIVIVSVSLIFGSTNLVLSQGSGGNITLNNSNMGAFDMYNSSAWNSVVITDRPVSSNSLIGSSFINSEWKIADIIVIENKAIIPNVPVRIDAQENLVEINHENLVKVLNAEKIFSLSFKTDEEVFISNKTLGIDEPVGFFKVLYSKKASLLCHYNTKLIKSSYNPVLDAGIKEDKLVIEETYYIMQNQKLIKVEKSNKKLVKQFSDQGNVVNYIKDQHLNPKLVTDLIKLVNFIDSQN